MNTIQIRKVKAVSSEVTRVGSHNSLSLTDTQSRQRRKKLIVDKSDSQVCPDGHFWAGEAGDTNQKQTSHVTGQGSTFGFLWLVLNCKQVRVDLSY